MLLVPRLTQEPGRVTEIEADRPLVDTVGTWCAGSIS